MSEWKDDILLNVASIQQGYAFKSEDFNNESGIPVIKIKNIASGKVDIKETQFYSKDYSALQKYLVKKGDILIAMTGSHLDQPASVVGRVSKYRKEQTCILNQRTAKIEPISGVINNNYLYYSLIQDETILILAGNASGSANQANISSTQIYNLPILLPTLSEQESIAEVLSSLDDKIDLLHRNNKTLEQLAETLFRQWFVEEADDSWEVKSLGEILTITSSKRVYYSEYVTSGIPFYRSKEIIELRNTGSTKSELFIPTEKYENIINKFGSLKEGDILMTSVGTLGVAYRVKKSEKFYFKDGNLTWFKDFTILPSSIIYLWLTSAMGQEELANVTIGSTQEALTIEGLKSIKFKIPPTEIILRTELIFNAILESIDKNLNQINTLIQLRDTLLPKLMSGIVIVN